MELGDKTLMLEWATDHKQFFINQGAAYGIHLRVTYIKNGQLYAVNTLLALIRCDPTKKDKSAEAAAKMLTNIIRESGLEKFKEFFTFQADFALTETMPKHMERLGTESDFIFLIIEA